MKFLKTASTDSFAITLLFTSGKMPTINETNPSFKELVEYLTSTPESEHDEDYVYSLAFPASNAGLKLTALSERVSVTDSNVFFDGDPLENAEADQLLRLIKEGKKVGPLVAFLEKVRQNENVESRDSLYRYLNKWNFTIANDGDIIAYKGVQADGTSVYTGTAFVDGVQVQGHIPNEVGAIISMPRSRVSADSDVPCAPGLHAGTYDYAKGWSRGKLLTIKINPRDVVSVPKDCGHQKMRTCRYEVLAEADIEYTEPIWDDEPNEDDYDDYDDYDERDDYDDENDVDEDDEVEDDNELDNIDPQEDVIQIVNPAVKASFVPSTGNKTLDIINQAIVDGEHLAFTYTKVDGTVKPVNGFVPNDVESGRNGLIVRGLNSEEEYRTYKLSNIEDLNAYALNPENDDLNEDEDVTPRATLTTPWSSN